MTHSAAHNLSVPQSAAWRFEMTKDVLALVVSKAAAAKMLGISKDSVDRLIAAGELQAIRLTPGKSRGRVGIKTSAIEAFLQAREREGL